MIFTFDIHTADAEQVPVQKGVFTSDDITGLAGADEDDQARAYVQSLADASWPAGDLACRLWRQHLESWSLLDTTPPDLTWTLIAPGSAP